MAVYLAQFFTQMKIFSLLSIAAVLVTASLTVAFASSTLSSVLPCIFLLLIAGLDYGPKVRSRRLLLSRNESLNTPSTLTQTYRLAA